MDIITVVPNELRRAASHYGLGQYLSACHNHLSPGHLFQLESYRQMDRTGSGITWQSAVALGMYDSMAGITVHSCKMWRQLEKAGSDVLIYYYSSREPSKLKWRSICIAHASVNSAPRLLFPFLCCFFSYPLTISFYFIYLFILILILYNSTISITLGVRTFIRPTHILCKGQFSTYYLRQLEEQNQKNTGSAAVSKFGV